MQPDRKALIACLPGVIGFSLMLLVLTGVSFRVHPMTPLVVWLSAIAGYIFQRRLLSKHPTEVARWIVIPNFAWMIWGGLELLGFLLLVSVLKGRG